MEFDGAAVGGNAHSETGAGLAPETVAVMCVAAVRSEFDEPPVGAFGHLIVLAGHQACGLGQCFGDRFLSVGVPVLQL
ncbi:hypothetical protein [Silicimonas sp. MF1-12-2]|uniref:hypothetical protein n=1 Tax=Silicimonas sp. MF1-12-2 TaxID=3384793 RepID=UPI0039B5D8B7